MQILTSPRVATILQREHQAAKEQRSARMASANATGGAVRHLDFRQSELHRTSYLSIGPAQGRWLCATAIACNAQEIVEFGSSYGISTLYLAAAAAQTGGRVTGTEYYSEKAEKARHNLEAAGLAANIVVGDALETLRGEGPEIDFLFLDGAKELYLPVLELLRPRLASGSVLVADNIPIDCAERTTGPTADFNDFITEEANGFISTVVGFGRSGMSFSVVL